MKITLLGTGGPRPDPDRQGSCLVITDSGKNILFDAGRGAGTQLARSGIPLREISAIFITHHHYDHICSLDDIILSSWSTGRDIPLQIFGPRGTADLVRTLLDQIYAKDIQFRLTEAGKCESKLVDINEIVTVTDIEPGLVHDQPGWQIFADDVEHGHGLGLKREEWSCLGYRVQTPAGIVAISGDAVSCDGLNRLARDADVLVQCCYLAKAEITDHDTALIAKFILASSDQVGEIAAKAGVKKLVLTHFRQKSSEMMQSIIQDVGEHFSGEVILGEDLMEIEL